MTELRHPAPKGLGGAGRGLWSRIVGDLHDEAEFDARELELLRNACRQKDTESQLENAIKKDGVMLVGAQGQRKYNSAVTELRQCRLAISRMLGELGLEDEIGMQAQTAMSRRASRAANVRWGNDQSSQVPLAGVGSRGRRNA